MTAQGPQRASITDPHTWLLAIVMAHGGDMFFEKRFYDLGAIVNDEGRLPSVLVQRVDRQIQLTVAPPVPGSADIPSEDSTQRALVAALYALGGSYTLDAEDIIQDALHGPDGVMYSVRHLLTEHGEICLQVVPRPAH